MALLIFFSSAGFTLDMHYCNGQLKNINFFGKAKSCHEIGQGMKNCPHHKKMMAAKNQEEDSINKKGCCSNKTVHFQSNQNQQYQADNALVLSTQLQDFVIAFVETFYKPAVSKTESPTYTLYKSPIIPRDTYVLFETFLI